MNNEKRSWRWLLVLLLLGFALRVFRLEAQSLWWDEGISLHLATSSWLEILANRVVNIHPPGYFFLLKGWVSLAGTSPFAARYLSVLASLAQIAAVYVVGKRWLSPAATGVALVLITVSPLSIIYAQETRVYALLPLIYLAVIVCTDRFLTASGGHRRRWLLGLVVVEWVGVHLHYISGFVMVYAAVWVLLVVGRQRDWGRLRAWLWAQIAVGLASLPWFGAVVWHVATVGQLVVSGTYTTQPVPFDFLLGQIWAFHLTGLAGVMGRMVFRWLAIAIAVLFGVALLMQISQEEGRRQRQFWLATWLIPLSSALLVWSVRSFAHPRYIIIFAVGLIPLLASLIVPGRQTEWWRQGTGVLLGAVTLGFLGLTLQGFFFDSDFQKDDVRGVAAFLEEEARPNDLIVIPDTDWSLQFEYGGSAPIFMPDTDSPADVFAALAAQTAGVQRVYQMDYPRGTRDWQEVVAFALEQAGTLTAVTSFDGVMVRTYELSGQPAEPTMGDGLLADFGDLQLQGSWVEAGAAADTAVTIALDWRVVAVPVADYSVSLALETVDEVPTAQTDAPLRDQFGRPTGLWEAGQRVTTYHILPLPPATPPIDFQALVTLYRLDEAGMVQVQRPLAAEGARAGGVTPLGQTNLGAPRGWMETPYGRDLSLPLLPEPVVSESGLALLGWAVNRAAFAPGETVFVTLLWQAQAALPEVAPVVSLVGETGVLTMSAGVAVNGRYPTSKWQPGQLVREVRALPLPAETSGDVALMVAFAEEEVVLGELTVAGVTRSFEAPQPAYATEAVFGEAARLVGFDLPETAVAAGDVVPVTLYWEALGDETAVNYRVFVHLVVESGEILAQHDGTPAGGQRPTSGWLSGEFVTDIHPVDLASVHYAGAARFVVGLYDPQTGMRIPLVGGDDSFELPIAVTIEDQ